MAKITKHTAKDSVFTDLFGIPEYLFQLYQAFHPEDHDTMMKDISNVTIKNVFLDQPYNDVGFQISNKLIILAECQASWTENIVIRCLMYLAQTYQEYLESTKQDIHSRKKIKLPEPELYVIFIGKRMEKPEYIYLSKEFFGGKESAVEVKVKMIYNGEKGDIINQYVTFTSIYNEQIKQHGRTRKAVLETIRICSEQDILKEYLENRKKEVVDIMMMLFDDEYIYRTHFECREREMAEEAEKKAKEMAVEMAKEIAEVKAREIAEVKVKEMAEVKAREIAEVKAKEMVETTLSERMNILNEKAALKLYRRGETVGDIADILETSLEQVKQWLAPVVV